MSPLSFAAIASARMADSISFYEDVIGFDVVTKGPCKEQVAQFLGFPTEQPIQAALMEVRGFPLGRILLLDPGTPGRERIRQPGDRTSRGLWNINFYVADIHATARELERHGYTMWHAPAEYEVGPGAGRVIEVVFEGPDGVAINLVQPLGDDSVFSGRLRAEIDRAGRTRTGFTPIATTANCVPAMATALPFYQRLLDLDVVIDAIFGKPETNRFLCRPPDARSHTVFLAGASPFGKLAINEPLNYAVAERLAHADAGSIGYFAQGFQVRDVVAASRRAVELGGRIVQAEGHMTLPGFSGEATSLIRSPDGGALVWLVQSQA